LGYLNCTFTSRSGEHILMLELSVNLV
jgi:hypothetical protein